MRHRVRLLHLNDLLSRILPADLAFRGLLPKLGGDAVGFLFGNEPRLRVAILSVYWILRRKFLNGWTRLEPERPLRLAAGCFLFFVGAVFSAVVLFVFCLVGG